MNRFIEMLENIILKLLDKLNIVTFMLLLVIFGVMNKTDVFQWLEVISKTMSGILP